MKAVIEDCLYVRAPEVFKTAEKKGLSWIRIPEGDADAALAAQKNEGAMAFVIGAPPFPDHFYQELKSGSLVQRFGVGFTAVPLNLCRDRCLIVGYTPGVLDVSVAEHALGMMLSLARKLHVSDREMRQGIWNQQSGCELKDKSLALIGFGNIAMRLASMAQLGFGMQILAQKPFPYQAKELSHVDVAFTDPLECVAQADFVSLHLPELPSTLKMVNEEFLAAMKPGAILINTSRGAVVDEDALLAALDSGHLGGAALDVFTTEPLPVDDTRFRGRDNVLLVPHCASNTTEANQRMAVKCVENCLAHLQGHPENVVKVPELTL